jgi:hypothetical protein
MFLIDKNAFLISFSGQTTYSYRPCKDTMAGVLELIRGPQHLRWLFACPKKAPRVDPKVLELQAAKEILAEVFGMRISEVEEMLRQRSEDEVPSCKGDGALWPESFCLGE